MKKSIILFALVAILAGCKKSGGSIKVTCTKYTNCNTSSGAIINASGATVRLVNINGSILEAKISLAFIISKAIRADGFFN